MDEFMDEELIGMIHYADGTAPAEMPRMEPKMRPRATDRRETAAPDAEYIPLQKGEPNGLERLKGCAKWSLICGGISMLLWWFQINGLMAMQAAYPCIVACGILGGFGVGKNAGK